MFRVKVNHIGFVKYVEDATNNPREKFNVFVHSEIIIDNLY